MADYTRDAWGPWQNLSEVAALVNGWAAVPGYTPQIRKSTDRGTPGIQAVQLRGRIAGGAGGTAPFVLPARFHEANGGNAYIAWLALQPEPGRSYTVITQPGGNFLTGFDQTGAAAVVTFDLSRMLYFALADTP